MKIIKQAFAFCIIVCFSISSKAQIVSSAKPSLFTSSAASFTVNITELDKAFLVKEGSQIQLNFANHFTFYGTVLSSVQRYGKLSSIIVKSPSLHNSLLSISKRINDDNSITYIGRILNESYADGYELKKNGDGSYAFHKIKTEDLIQDYYKKFLLPLHNTETPKSKSMKKLFTIIFLPGLFFSFKANSTPILSSLPTAQATIFLDFDGQYVHGSSWNGGSPLDCASSGLTDVQITEVFNRVSEDYRPFDINITTDSTVFLAAPLTKRIRIIVTSTSSWYPNVGGVSYTGSFTWGDDTPGFVFSDKLGPFRPKMVAECCSHESGHTLGLSHQAKYSGTCTLVATYNDGIGAGETAWAPVMGNSYYRNFSGWNNGPTPSGCTADQDNLSIITSINGFTYRRMIIVTIQI